MPSAPMKIRCYNCGQLLGVSRSKAGRVISCPKCASELNIPGLDAMEVVEAEKAGVVNEPQALLEELSYLERLSEEPPATSVPKPALDLDPPLELPTIETKIPSIRVESTRKITASTTAGKSNVGNRDLLIPRSIVAAWSLLVLAALMFAFLTGLLAGHFIWREH